MSLGGSRTSASVVGGLVRRGHYQRTKSAAKNEYGRSDDRFTFTEDFGMGLVISRFMTVGVKGNYRLIPVHGV